jgi:hypothetical protein
MYLLLLEVFEPPNLCLAFLLLRLLARSLRVTLTLAALVRAAHAVLNHTGEALDAMGARLLIPAGHGK